MARLTFPDEQMALIPGVSGGVVRNAIGATAVVYTDAAGTQLADIQTLAGVTIPGSALAIDAYSRLAPFLGPDGVSTLYVSIDGGPITPINADVGSRLSSQDSTIAAMQSTVDTYTDTVDTYTTAIDGKVTKGDLVLNAKDYGAIGNGTADDTAALQAAFSAASSNATDLFIPPGTYKLTSGITWDAAAHSVIGGGNVFLDFGAMTSGFAITVLGQNGRSNSWGFLEVIHQFAGMSIAGPDTDATTVDCFSVADSGNGSHVNFDRLRIYGFRDQFALGNNTWCLRWTRCMFEHGHRYGVNTNTPLGTTNRGEAYTFFGCTFSAIHNASNSAAAVYNPVPGSEFAFYGCSFDYDDIEIIHGSGDITLTGCHVENNSANPMFKVSYTGSYAPTTLSMLGGAFAPSEAGAGRDHLIEFTGGDNVNVTLSGVNVGMYGHKTDVAVVLAGLPTMNMTGGLLSLSSAPSLSRPGQLLNMLSNPGFELNSFAAWTPQGTVAYSVQSATKNSGTYAAKIAGTGVAGTTALLQVVPVMPNRQFVFTAEMSADTMTAGSTAPRIQWFASDNSTVLSTTTLTAISANQSFTRSGTYGQIPAGARYASVQFWSQNLNGNVYVDDVYFTYL